MVSETPRSTLHIARHPLQSMLMPVAVVCFVGTLLTDIAYWRTADMSWANFSAWLLTAGLVFGVLAWLASLVDFLGNPLIRALRVSWLHLIGNLVVLLLAFFDALVHTRDAWTSVVPTGLILSAVVAVLVLITGWLGGTMVYRHGVGVTL